MSLTIEQSYGLLFHLMEYWDREKKAAKMAAVIRLESADIDDPETLVGLDHVKTFPPKAGVNKTKLKWVQYSFPPQPSNPSLEKFHFLTPEGYLEGLSLAKEKDVPDKERLTNFSKGRVCFQIPGKLDKATWFSEEDIHTLTEYSDYPPGAKQSAFLGNVSDLTKWNLEIEEIDHQIEEGATTLEAEEKKIKSLEKKCEEFEEFKGFVDQFIDDPELRNITFSLLRRDMPIPALPPHWEMETSAPEISELVKVAASLDNSYLAIQGPPGSGKTWTGARIIHHLVTVEKKKVGITAQAKAAIDNLLEETVVYTKEKMEQDPGILNARRRYESETPLDGVVLDDKSKPSDLANEEALLFASTTWFWAHPEFDAEENKFDYLVIDEAGQLSLADALAASKGTKNVILLGDPQQLSQVAQASHPAGGGVDSGASILGHLLEGDATISSDRGVFLDKTWRLDPAICTFISEEFYESRLKPVESINRRIEGRENGLFWIPVPHDETDPCVDQNQKEAEKIAEIISSLLDGSRFIEDGKERPITIKDFMVVAPFNRQRKMIREILQKKLDGIDSFAANSIVGTVDKFQGRQAPVVLYSLTTSSHDSIPKGREDFLFSPNRLNVAISRAQCMAFLVGSETLIDARATSIPEMRALNHFCRYVDDPSLKSSQHF